MCFLKFPQMSLKPITTNGISSYKINCDDHININSGYKNILFELARSQKKTPWEIEQSGAPSPKQVLEFYCYIQKKAEEEKEKEKEDTK